MNQVLKNRLVGVAVLLLISVIVWPLLFRFDATSIDISDEELAKEAASIDQQIEQLRKDTQHIQEQVLGSSERELKREREAVAAEIAEHPELELPQSPQDVGKFQQNQPVAKVEAEQKSSPAELDSQGIPVSWVAQIATFSQWVNANELKEELIEAGYKAFQRPEDKKLSGPYVIYVGPTIDRAKSTEYAKQIEQEFGTGKGIVRRFKGGQH